MSERQRKKTQQKEANKLKRRMIEKVLSNSRSTNAAFNLNLLVDGWLELESDPGTFSLLIEDFGCFGAQVDEIYDLEQKFDGPVFGFIFLFKWLHHQQSDRSRNNKSTSSSNSTTNNNDANSNDKDPERSPESDQWSYVKDESILGDIFFAKQMISNSCATHALISILMNCDYDELNLGPTLTRLKEYTRVMNPENRGYAIGNLPELAKAHNSHASCSSLYNRNKPSSYSSGMSYMISGNQRTNLQQQNQHEAYHFVSYVPINNRLYELDGLKNYPIDHGPFNAKEDWTEKFRRVIMQRLQANKTGDDETKSNDIRYSLMAVVPDKRVCLRARLRSLKSHQKVIQESILRLTKKKYTPLSVDVDIPNPPYSPLSNATLTASEAGSAFNSPTGAGGSFFLDDDHNKIDRHFFIKFEMQAEPNDAREENNDLAHKNCIVEREPLLLQPINLTTSAVLDDVEEAKAPNNTEIAKASKITTSDSTDLKRDSDKSAEATKSNEVGATQISDVTHVQAETKTNGHEFKDGVEVNETPAHGNEKYNLSSEPPFEFNIMDEMQHVHTGKSTLKDLKILLTHLSYEISKFEAALNEEIDKRRKYKLDNSRRTHNYEPFIMTFLSMLAKQGKLADLIERDLGIISDETTGPAARGPTARDTPSSSVVPPVIPKATPAKPPKVHAAGKVSTTNGRWPNKNNSDVAKVKPKPKYRYVSTGRPVGRPRKHPLVVSPAKPEAK